MAQLTQLDAKCAKSVKSAKQKLIRIWHTKTPGEKPRAFLL